MSADIIKYYGPVTNYYQYVCAHCGEEGDENAGPDTIVHTYWCPANEPNFNPTFEDREDPETCEWCGFVNEECGGIVSCHIDGITGEEHLT